MLQGLVLQGFGLRVHDVFRAHRGCTSFGCRRISRVLRGLESDLFLGMFYWLVLRREWGNEVPYTIP